MGGIKAFKATSEEDWKTCGSCRHTLNAKEITRLRRGVSSRRQIWLKAAPRSTPTLFTFQHTKLRCNSNITQPPLEMHSQHRHSDFLPSFWYWYLLTAKITFWKESSGALYKIITPGSTLPCVSLHFKMKGRKWRVAFLSVYTGRPRRRWDSVWLGCTSWTPALALAFTAKIKYHLKPSCFCKSGLHMNSHWVATRLTVQ